MAENCVRGRRKAKVYRLLQSASVDDTYPGGWALVRGRRIQKHGGIAVGQGDVPWRRPWRVFCFFFFAPTSDQKVQLSELRPHQAWKGVVRKSGMGRVNDRRIEPVKKTAEREERPAIPFLAICYACLVSSKFFTFIMWELQQ
jgi:hypothetical protein